MVGFIVNLINRTHNFCERREYATPGVPNNFPSIFSFPLLILISTVSLSHVCFSDSLSPLPVSEFFCLFAFWSYDFFPPQQTAHLPFGVTNSIRLQQWLLFFNFLFFFLYFLATLKILHHPLHSSQHPLLSTHFSDISLWMLKISTPYGPRTNPREGWIRAKFVCGMLSPKLYTKCGRPLGGWWCIPSGFLQSTRLQYSRKRLRWTNETDAADQNRLIILGLYFHQNIQ